jgi:hypothetical protein
MTDNILKDLIPKVTILGNMAHEIRNHLCFYKALDQPELTALDNASATVEG